MPRNSESGRITLPASALEDRSITSGTIVRAMSPAGIYWPAPVSFPGASYVNCGDLIFTACHFDEDRQPNDYYTDFDDPRVEEVRLLAALALPLEYDHGLMFPFPSHERIEIAERSDLDDNHAVRNLEVKLRARLAQQSKHQAKGMVPPLPPCVGGAPYELRTDPNPLTLQRRIFDAIDLTDYLTLRGLCAFLRSQMLTSGSTFQAEGLYTLYVSLDATFAVTLRRLKAKGIGDPTAFDAQVFVEEAFGDEPSGMRYFEEFYEDRIKALHPESRFGTFSYPPLSMSEGYQLSKGLRSVWRLLITGVADGARDLP
jgi:hypothetical protein